ncbi:hypothetical protein BGZ81_002340 [Podila clonocystis]|nr:hypothetical protein BGZ81_002340 [Podila clonocystis]
MAVKDDNFFEYLIQFCPRLEELHLWMRYFRIGQIVKFPDGKTTRWSSGVAKGRRRLRMQSLNGWRTPSDFEFMRKNPARASEAKSTWPDLESFHIRYRRIEVHQSMCAITATVHDIRPAVEFRIKKNPSLHLPQ